MELIKRSHILYHMMPLLASYFCHLNGLQCSMLQNMDLVINRPRRTIFLTGTPLNRRIGLDVTFTLQYMVRFCASNFVFPFKRLLRCPICFVFFFRSGHGGVVFSCFCVYCILLSKMNKRCARKQLNLTSYSYNKSIGNQSIIGTAITKQVIFCTSRIT